MAKNTQIFFTSEVEVQPSKFAAADGTDYKTVFTPSSEGSRIEAIAISSSKATSTFVKLRIQNGSFTAQIGHVTVPGNAGQGTVNVVSGLNRGNLPWLAIDANGNPYVNLKSGQLLQVAMGASLVSAEEVDITVFGSGYQEVV